MRLIVIVADAPGLLFFSKENARPTNPVPFLMFSRVQFVLGSMRFAIYTRAADRSRMLVAISLLAGDHLPDDGSTVARLAASGVIGF